jgi:hypothetical protein
MFYDYVSLEYTSEFGVQLNHETASDLKLWCMVFYQAVADYEEALQFDRSGGVIRAARITEDRKAIREWFASDEEHVGSFNWLCDLFGYDANRVRGLVENKGKATHLNVPRGKRVREETTAGVEEGEDDGE